jgi:hypothetical protein
VRKWPEEEDTKSAEIINKYVQFDNLKKHGRMLSQIVMGNTKNITNCVAYCAW